MTKNKIKSGLITAAVIAGMTLPATTAFASTTFSDVKPDNWYYFYSNETSRHRYYKWYR